MNLFRLIRAGAIALVCCAVATGALAQTITTGTISGEVKDAQGGVIPGASVTATHVPTGTMYEALTGADGRYLMQGVRVGGPYRVTINMPGFKPYDANDLTARLGETLTLDATPQLATVSETVTVISEAPTVDLTRAGTATNIQSAVIEALPTI